MYSANGDDTATWKKLFPRNVWKQPGTISLALLSMVSGVLLALMLLTGFLIIDLFASRGEVVFRADQLAKAQEVFGSSLDMIVPDDPKNVASETVLQNRGIMHTLWTFHERHWTKPVISLYRQFPFLRENNTALLVLLILISVIGLVRGLVQARCRLIASFQGLSISNQLRRALHRQAIRLGPSDLLDEQTQKAYDLFCNETNTIRDLVANRYYRIFVHPVSLVILVFLGIALSPRLFIQMLLPLLGCWILVEREQTRLKKSRELMDLDANRRSKILAESLTKTRLIRGYSMEQFNSDHFSKLVDQLSSSAKLVRRREIFSRWVCWGMVLCCVMLLMLLMGVKVLVPVDHPQHMELAEITLISAIFMYAYHPLIRLRDIKDARHDTTLAADRIYRFLDQIPEVGQAVGAKFLDPVSKSITYENVTYSLPGVAGKRLLNQFEAKIPAQGVSVIATTNPLEAKAMLYLLPRFIEPQNGRVLFDGEDIAWVTLESLRAEVMHVGGKELSFTGSVLDNILCGDQNLTRSDAVSAAKKVHAHNFIQQLSMGYDTVLGEHGEQLTPGEAYRLGLARAIVRNPALLLLEELDLEVNLTEEDKSLIDDAYDHIFPGRSVIIIPGRMNTIRRSDRIILLYQGQLATIDQHASLLAGNELYRHWEYTQFNVFRRKESV